MSDQNQTTLRFEGSLWCNLDVALRAVDRVYNVTISSFDLTVVEWYILRYLYRHDGAHASELADAVGRAATSFTPILDKLQSKGFIERRPDTSDRRAVQIYLLPKALRQKEAILESSAQIEEKLQDSLHSEDYAIFQKVLLQIQNL